MTNEFSGASVQGARLQGLNNEWYLLLLLPAQLSTRLDRRMGTGHWCSRAGMDLNTLQGRGGRGWDRRVRAGAAWQAFSKAPGSGPYQLHGCCMRLTGPRRR
jgi:hypothetical protein